MFYLLFLNGLRFKSVADLWSLQHTEKAGQENTASDVWVLKRSHVRVQAQVSGRAGRYGQNQISRCILPNTSISILQQYCRDDYGSFQKIL